MNKNIFRELFSCYYVPIENESGMPIKDEKMTLLNKFKTYLCCSGNKKNFLEMQKQKIIMKELIDSIPQKSDLSTHDGVIFFPKELMPEENENILGTFHEDINGNRIQLPT